MASVRTIALAGVIGIAATSLASAADLRGPIYHEPLPMYQEVEVEFAGGWYLRGDIGISNQSVKKLTNAVYDNNGDQFEFIHKGFTSSPLIAAGFGYQFNNWFRMDLTGEYRSKAGFSALDRYGADLAVAVDGTNYFTAKKHEWVGLLNAYIDLGTWHGITPFAGVGVGLARVTISDFTDTNSNVAVWAAPTASRTNFAWALYAGAAVDVTDNLKLELAYRYLRMGDGRAGSPNFDVRNVNPPVTAPWVFRRLESHDVKVGMRWMFAPPTRIAHYWPDEPLIRKN